MVITQTDEFQHKKYSSSSQYCILHSVIQTTEFSSEGTKLEITSANEIPTDKHDELKDIKLGAETVLHNIKLTLSLPTHGKKGSTVVS